MLKRVWDFIDYNPCFAYCCLGIIFFVIMGLMIGSYMSGQKTNAQAQCESIGGIYGSNECYVDGELYGLKVER